MNWRAAARSRCSRAIVALGDAQRHHILELVAESICTAQLIECRARPYTACQRLVEQPAIHEHIHGRIGRVDLHGAEHVVPRPRNLGQDCVQVRGAIACEQFTRSFAVFRFAQEKHDFRLRAGAQVNRSLQRRARIETCSQFSGKWTTSFQGRGMPERAVASDKFRAVAGDRKSASPPDPQRRCARRILHPMRCARTALPSANRRSVMM